MNDESAPPGTAARVQELRVRAGLDAQTLADQLKITLPWYYDLEAFDDELFTTLSLEQVVALARLLGVSPLVLVTGAEHARGASPAGTSIEQLTDLIRDHLSRESISVEDFSERVGWEMAPALADPAHAWREWNIDCLRDVCAELRIEWEAIFRE